MSDKLEILLDNHKLEVAVKKLNAAEYFHAKSIHEAAEVHTEGNKPDSFLRLDDTRAYIITRALMDKSKACPTNYKSEDKSFSSVATYETEDGNTSSPTTCKSEDENTAGTSEITVDLVSVADPLILKDSKGNEYNVAELEQRNAYLSATNKERLPAELEAGMVHTPSRNQGSFFREDLMMKYAQYLDKKLEAACLDALNRLRKLSQLPADKQADVHIDTAVEILRKDAKPHQTPEKRLDTKTKTKYLNTVLDSMIPAGEVKDDWYALMHSETNKLFEHTASEMKQLVDSSKSPRENMSDRCLHVIEAVEALVVDELLGMRSAKVQLTKKLLISISKEAVALVKPRLFKWSTEIDFLANENKKTKVLTEVTLKSDYSTSKQITNLKQLT